MFTEEEFHQFEQERQKEVQRMMEMGQIPQGYPYPNIPAMPPVGQYHVSPRERLELFLR